MAIRDERMWAKAAFEASDFGTRAAVCVVTDQVSDDANGCNINQDAVWLRIVRVGDYDACACIGAHVKNTAEIGTFKILSHDYETGRWRVRWKVQ